MALSIKNPEVDRLAREVARETGETMTDAILHALQERLRRLRGRTQANTVSDEIAVIQARVSELPLLDERPPDEILGYDRAGLPG